MVGVAAAALSPRFHVLLSKPSRVAIEPPPMQLVYVAHVRCCTISSSWCKKQRGAHYLVHGDT